jgi:hypothetical protein
LVFSPILILNFWAESIFLEFCRINYKFLVFVLIVPVAFTTPTLFVVPLLLYFLPSNRQQATQHHNNYIWIKNVKLGLESHKVGSNVHINKSHKPKTIKKKQSPKSSNPLTKTPPTNPAASQ